MGEMSQCQKGGTVLHSKDLSGTVQQDSSVGKLSLHLSFKLAITESLTNLIVSPSPIHLTDTS